MATRLYLSANETHGLTPAFDAGWNVTASAIRRIMRPDLWTNDPLANSAAIASTSGQSVLFYQFLSPPMVSGLGFTTSITYKCQMQGLESAVNDNIINRVRDVKVVSRNGATVQSTQITNGNATSVVEWNTAMRNLSFLTSQTGANYTTVAGDRLLLEVGYDTTSGTSISGTMRAGTSGGTGDLAENETDTTTTLRPWFETSLTLIWEIPAKPVLSYRPSVHGAIW